MKTKINLTCGTGLLTLYLILLINLSLDQITLQNVNCANIVKRTRRMFNCTQRTLFVYSKEDTPGTGPSPIFFFTLLRIKVSERNINKH